MSSELSGYDAEKLPDLKAEKRKSVSLFGIIKLTGTQAFISLVVAVGIPGLLGIILYKAYQSLPTVSSSGDFTSYLLYISVYYCLSFLLVYHPLLAYKLLDNKTGFYISLTLILILWFFDILFNIWPGVFLLVITFICGFSFVLYLYFLDGEQEIKNNTNYELLSIHKGDIYSREMDYLFFVDKIENSIIHFKDKSIGSLLKVKPINFEIKSREEKLSIIYSYQNFLNSLNFPIKEIVRTILLNLDPYLLNLKKRYVSGNDALVSLQHDFIKFWENYTSQRFIKNRLFYIYIGIEEEASDFLIKDDELREKNKIKRLNLKVDRLKRNFQKMKMEINNLSNAETLNYYPSYFNSLEETSEEFGFPVILPEEVI